MIRLCVYTVSGKCSKMDKVVKREICSIQTKGTKRLSFIDGDTTDSYSQFLLALCEKVGTYLLSLLSATNAFFCFYLYPVLLPFLLHDCVFPLSDFWFHVIACSQSPSQAPDLSMNVSGSGQIFIAILHTVIENCTADPFSNME